MNTLDQVEILRGASKIKLRGLFDAIDPGAKLDDVDIDLEDPILREVSLEFSGEQRFLDLAAQGAIDAEPQVPRGLLGDGAGSA